MENTYVSKQKFLIGSPRKLRLVVAMIKKMKPLEAVDKLPFITRKASYDLLKVVKSALANARNQGATDTDLVFKEIQVGQGPNLKRGRAASRGRWHPYVKKMSHITIVLTAKNEKVKKEVKKVSNPPSLKLRKGRQIIKKGQNEPES